MCRFSFDMAKTTKPAKEFYLLEKPKIWQTTSKIVNLADSIGWLNRLLAECTSPNIPLQPLSDTEVRVWPNPVVDVLRVVILSNEIMNGGIVEIYDMTGRRVFLARLPNGTTEFSIDMSAFRAGNYIFRIGGGMMKIIKQ